MTPSPTDIKKIDGVCRVCHEAFTVQFFAGNASAYEENKTCCPRCLNYSVEGIFEEEVSNE